MYPTDLTDSAWEVIHEIVADKRKRKYPAPAYRLRTILNALLYITKTGCQWRMLPKDLPPWPICYYYFWKWRNEGQWEKLNKALVERRRLKAGREASPSVGVIDSQSVKNSEWGVIGKGFDGNKRVQGRKRHIIVDTLGLILVVLVGPANRHDSYMARQVLTRIAGQLYDRLWLILADSAYGVDLAKWALKTYNLMLRVVKVSDLEKFKVIPMRWKVEPVRRCGTFSWLSWSRRLSKDYECEPVSHESFVYLSNISRMVKHF